MSIIERRNVRWIVRHGALEDLKPIRERFGGSYTERKKQLQSWLCTYFSSGDCRGSGIGISPIGGRPDGGKVLKVRWAFPGCGKRGGLRLIVVAHCDDKRVELVGCWLRSDDPSDADVLRALTTSYPPIAAVP